MMKFLIPAFLLISCATFAQHTVSMKSGEKMYGTVKSLNDGNVEFLYKGNVMKLKVTDIYSINFAEVHDKLGSESTSAAPKQVGEKQITAGDYLVRYKVADRTISKPPKIDNLTQEKGTVVVDITIDKYGHVKKAVPGSTGSTTDSQYLMTKAKQAAESTIFNNVPTAPLEQTGYIVFVF